MAHQIGSQEAIAFAEFNFAMAVEFTGDTLRSYKMVQSAYPKVIRYCSAWDKSIAIGHKTHILFAGKVRENAMFIEQAMPILQQTGDISMLHTTYSTLFACHQMLGNTHEAAVALKKQRELPGAMELAPFSATFFLCEYIQGLLVQEEFGPEMDQAIAKLTDIGIDMYHSRTRFSLMGLARLEQVRSATDDSERRSHLASLAKFVRKSGFPVALTPLHLSMHYFLKGAWHALHSNFRRAERNLKRAEKLATSSDNHWALWLVMRERARIAETLGDDLRKASEAGKALEFAAANGWLPLVNQIQRDFQVSLASEEIESKATARFRGNYGKLLTAEHNPDVSLTFSLTLLASVDSKLQVQTILDELIKVLGAESAFFLSRDQAHPESLTVLCGRASDDADLTHLASYSHSVVQRVVSETKPVIVGADNGAEFDGSQSLTAQNLKSILAAPIFSNENHLIGVIYLDSTLASGIFSASDLEIVNSLAGHIAASMSTKPPNAPALQSIHLPKRNLLPFEQIKMASFYSPSHQNGGDWWWYNCDNDDAVFSIVMGDVTDSAVTSSVISAAVSGVYHTFKSLNQGKHRVSDFLDLLRATIQELPSEQAIPALNAIEINLATGELDLRSAGSPPPIVIIKQTGRCEFVTPTHGSTETTAIAQQTLQLDSGDRVVLFSDGLFGTGFFSDGSLGKDRLLQLLQQTRAEGVDKVANTVIARLLDLQSSNQACTQDLSFVALDFLIPSAQKRTA